LYSAYRKLADANELRVLSQYYAQRAQQRPAEFVGYPAAAMWCDIGNLNLAWKETAAAAECARRAVRCEKDHRKIRLTSAVLLSADQQWEEAEPHIRWCLQRMPENVQLQKLAQQAAEARLGDKPRIASGVKTARQQ
jgi:hypothetical protein